MPYRDAFAIKSPGMFYLDAAALTIIHNPLWSAWCLDVVFTVIGAIISFTILRQIFDPRTGMVATLLWMAAFALLREGTRPEELALPIQFAIVLLLTKALHGPLGRCVFYGVLSGILATFLFSMKVNLIGTSCAAIITSVIVLYRQRRIRVLIQYITAFTFGAVITAIPIFLHYGLAGALDDMYTDIILFGRSYADVSLATRIQAFGEGAMTLAPAGILLIGAIGWMSTALNQIPHKLNLPEPLVIAMIDLPLSYIMISLPGRSFDYYYTPLMPSLSVLAALTIHSFFARSSQNKLSLLMVASLIIPSCFLPIARELRYISMSIQEGDSTEEVVDFIESHTSSSDTILVWGHEPWVYVASDRRSPVKEWLAEPLFTKGFTEPEMYDQLIANLQTSTPDLIIDTAISGYIAPPISARDRERWSPDRSSAFDDVYYVPDEVQLFYDFVLHHYHLVGHFGDDGWAVYAVNER